MSSKLGSSPGNRRRVSVASTNQALSGFLQKRYNFSQSNRKSLFEAVRSRHSKNLKTLDASTVSSVIDGYLIPLFEADFRSSSAAKRRNQTFEFKGTVYNELKMSQKLGFEKEELIEQGKTLEKHAKTAEQAKTIAEADYTQKVNELLSAQSSLFALNFQYSLTLQETHRQEQVGLLALSRLHKQEKLLHKLSNNAENLKKQISDQRVINDKLKSTVLELQHVNALITMGSEVMGERLKGLHSALFSIAAVILNSAKYSEELKGINDYLIHIVRELGSSEETAAGLIIERNECFRATDAIASENIEINYEKAQLTRLYTEKIAALNTALSQCTKDRESFKEKYYESNTQYKNLFKEHSLLKNELKKRKTRNSEETSEKVCVHCQKSFTEENNYNWSCRTHRSEFQGDIYFCCGEPGKDAPGCTKSKHIPNETDDGNSNSPRSLVSYCSVSFT